MAHGSLPQSDTMIRPRRERACVAWIPGYIVQATTQHESSVFTQSSERMRVRVRARACVEQKAEGRDQIAESRGQTAESREQGGIVPAARA